MCNDIELTMRRGIKQFISMQIPTVTHNSLMPIMAKGKPKIAKTPELHEAEAVWESHLAVMRELVPDGPLSGAIIADVRFAFQADKKHPAGMPHTEKPDTDNLEKTFWDVLQRLGIIKDDCQIFRKDIAKLYAKKSGVYVKLQEVTALIERGA